MTLSLYDDAATDGYPEVMILVYVYTEFTGAQIYLRGGEPVRRILHLFRTHPKGHFIWIYSLCACVGVDIRNIFVHPRLGLKFTDNSYLC